MYNQIQTSPLPRFRMIVLKDFTYDDVTVPAGYITNGADVPRIFWSFFPPNRSDYLPAVIVHDYLCDAGEYEKADEYFEAIMIELGIGEVTIFCMTKAVRIYHWVKYSITL